MLRLAAGIAVVAAIYMHSPSRPTTAAPPDFAALASAAETHLTNAAAAGALAPILAEAVLRHTLPVPRDDAAGAPAPGSPGTLASGR